jgi:hypothetical protein
VDLDNSIHIKIKKTMKLKLYISRTFFYCKSNTILIKNLFSFRGTALQLGLLQPHSWGFWITHNDITFRMTPLDEGSARHKFFCLATNITHKRQTCPRRDFFVFSFNLFRTSTLLLSFLSCLYSIFPFVFTGKTQHKHPCPWRDSKP